MPLPHFSQLQSTNVNNEAIYPSLFEITFVLPTILQQQGRDPLMLLENATKVDLPLTPEISVETQRFKYSTRAYVTLPNETHMNFDIDFNVNANIDGSIFVWNTLKAWYDLAWNSQDGSASYKRDMVGTLIVHHHDKAGQVLRRVTYHNCQLHGIGDINLDWSNNSTIIESVNAKFVSDHWTDEYLDDNFEIVPGNINGL